MSIGTFLYTLFAGKFVGKDDLGNKYYKSSSGKRWVIYKNEIEATKISSEWYLWMHFVKNEFPNERIKKKYLWQLPREENKTGTDKAHKPRGSIMSSKNKYEKKYETWKN